MINLNSILPIEYPKIYPPYKFGVDEWFKPEFNEFKLNKWEWTEKIDGINTRIYWDSHAVRIGGRTDSAQFPTALYNFYREVFTEELFESVLQDQKTMLFGESVGPGLLKSGKYSLSFLFILFDAYVFDITHPMGGWWLRKDSIDDIGEKLKVPVVPFIGHFSVPTIIDAVSDGYPSAYGSFPVEGLVGRAPCGIIDRAGNRLIMKVKTKDFPQ